VKVELARRGASAHGKSVGDDWRTWAYEEAIALAGRRLEGPVVVAFTPTCATRAKLCNVESAMVACQMVMAGLVAGGLLSGARGEVVALTIKMPLVTGDDGMRVEAWDCHEPF
jgi:hypothetical protein